MELEDLMHNFREEFYLLVDELCAQFGPALRTAPLEPPTGLVSTGKRPPPRLPKSPQRPPTSWKVAPSSPPPTANPQSPPSSSTSSSTLHASPPSCPPPTASPPPAAPLHPHPPSCPPATDEPQPRPPPAPAGAPPPAPPPAPADDRPHKRLKLSNLPCAADGCTNLLTDAHARLLGRQIRGCPYCHDCHEQCKDLLCEVHWGHHWVRCNGTSLPPAHSIPQPTQHERQVRPSASPNHSRRLRSRSVSIDRMMFGGVTGGPNIPKG